MEDECEHENEHHCDCGALCCRDCDDERMKGYAKKALRQFAAEVEKIINNDREWEFCTETGDANDGEYHIQLAYLQAKFKALKKEVGIVDV